MVTPMKHKVYPNFLIVGAAKAGTTSLYEYLKDHPDIFLSNPKEPTFFPFAGEPKPTYTTGRPVNFVTDEDQYFSLFENSGNKKCIGEASTPYLYLHDKSIQNIKKIVPNYKAMKIIIILRNPTDRAFSQYMHKRRECVESLTFSEAIEQEVARIKNNAHIDFHYTQRSLYHDSVKAFMDEFDQVLVCFYDDLKNNPANFVKKVLRFLDVEAEYLPATFATFNESGIPTNPFFRKLLIKEFPGKTILKKLIPLNIKAKIFKKIRSGKVIKMYIEAADKELLNIKFKNDLSKLKLLLDGDLPIWLNSAD